MKVDQEEILNYNQKEFLESLNNKYQIWKTNSNYKKRILKKDAPKKISKIEDVYEIPLVDMAEFKKYPEKLSIGKIDFNLYSSGSTSGTRSKGPRTKNNFKIQRKFFNNLSKEMNPNSINYFALISPSKKEFSKVPDPKVSNRSVFHYASWGFEEPYESENFMNFSSGRPEINFKNLYKNLEERSGDKGLFGTQKYVISFLKYLKKNNLKTTLGENGIIATGGGSSKELSGKEFRDMCNEYLGVEKKNHVDFYGCTESMLMLANKAGDENPDKKRIPSQGMVFVVDEKELRESAVIKPLGLNKPGLAVFIDALNESHPGAILTDDIVIKTGERYGENARIQHLGRSTM